MIAFTESNFILEIALGQRDASFADGILRLAESGAITLVMPSLATIEPFSTVVQRGRRRQRVYQSVDEETRDLSRSDMHQGLASSIDSVKDGLLEAEKSELVRLEQVTERVLEVATVVQLDAAIVAAAREARTQFDLKPQDAIVFASIIDYARAHPADESMCFISANWKDFDLPDIQAELSRYHIVFLPNFRRGLEFCQPRGIRER